MLILKLDDIDSKPLEELPFIPFFCLRYAKIRRLATPFNLPIYLRAGR
jgi:hypothetical protein